MNKSDHEAPDHSESTGSNVLIMIMNSFTCGILFLGGIIGILFKYCKPLVKPLVGILFKYGEPLVKPLVGILFKYGEPLVKPLVGIIGGFSISKKEKTKVDVPARDRSKNRQNVSTKYISLSRSTARVSSECDEDGYEKIAQLLSKEIMFDIGDKIKNKEANQVIKTGIKNVILNRQAAEYNIDSPMVNSQSKKESTVKISIKHENLNNNDSEIVVEVFSNTNVY